MAKHFVTIERDVTPNAHWQVVMRDIGKARAQAIAYALCQYVPDALVRVHAGTPDDQCIISMWRNGEFVSYDAWLAMLAMLATPATPATPATYGVWYDDATQARINQTSIAYDTSQCIAHDLTFDEALQIAARERNNYDAVLVCNIADYMALCDAHEHDTNFDCDDFAHMRAIACVRFTRDNAHEHTLDLQDRILGMLANGEERSDAQLCALLHVAPALVDDAIHALYESDRVACDARRDAIYVRALA